MAAAGQLGRRGRNDQGVFSSLQPAGTVGAEPAWSPDGLWIAYTRYTLDADTGDVTGSQLRVIDVRTGADTEVSGTTGLIQADWRSATTLIAAGGAAGEGLFTIASTGGTPAAVAGTANSGFPEVAPNGKTYFVSGDGTNFALNVLSTTGVVTPLQTSTSHFFESPRVSPDGTLYYVDVDLGVLDDPSDNLFTVMSSANGTGTPEETAVGRQPAGRSRRVLRLRRAPAQVQGHVGPRRQRRARHPGPRLQRQPLGLPEHRDQLRRSSGQGRRGWNIFNAFIAAGDLNGDNRGDILARDTLGGLWRYDGRGAGKVAPGVRIGTGWNSYLPLAPGDFNGDGKADLIARASNGELWLYPGTGLGTLGARTRIGAGWQGMNAIVGVGDFDLDNDADLIARVASTSKLWLYPGNGKGGFSTPRQVGSGWNGFKAILGPEMLGTNTFVYAQTGTGQMLAYLVVGDGRFDGNEVYNAGTGWSTYSATS